MARCAIMSPHADLGPSVSGGHRGFADTEEMLNRVQHDLRTPLTSIRAVAEILLDNPELSKADQRAFLAIIVDESERLADAASWVAAIVEADARLQAAGPSDDTPRSPAGIRMPYSEGALPDGR